MSKKGSKRNSTLIGLPAGIAILAAMLQMSASFFIPQNKYLPGLYNTAYQQ